MFMTPGLLNTRFWLVSCFFGTRGIVYIIYPAHMSSGDACKGDLGLMRLGFGCFGAAL